MFDRIKKLKFRKYKNCNIIHNVMIDKYSNIGEYTYVGHYSIITKSDIGRYCSIAPFVTIGLGEHDLSLISTSSEFYEDNVYNKLTKDNVVIGNDVWIGTKATILRGVKIGNGAVIGANSVVTRDIPDFAIAVGAPARVIKYRFSKDDIEKINKSRWWDNEIDIARNIQKNILNSNYKNI